MGHEIAWSRGADDDDGRAGGSDNGEVKLFVGSESRDVSK